MMKQNQKILFIVLLLLTVISSDSVGRVLADEEISVDDTSDALTRLRAFMTGIALGIEPVIAYIVPSDDAHQVCEQIYISQNHL